MINTVRDPRYYPSIVHHMTLAADNTDCFNGTDLEKIPTDGWLLTQIVSDNTDGTYEVQQLGKKPGTTQNIPVLNAGVYQALDKLPCYKTWVAAGQSPIVAYDEVSGSIADLTGMFYRGRKNPVAINAPDILVCKSAITATTSNVLEGTDLEDISWPGTLIVWATANTATEQIQIGQMGHKPGRYNLIPHYGAGVGLDISSLTPMKAYCPNGEPVIAITEVGTCIAIIMAAYYVDWRKVNEPYPHNPFI